MWFRSLLGLVTAVCWGFAIWAAFHVSEKPAFLRLYSPGYAAFVAGSIAVSLAMTVVHWTPIYRRIHQRRFAIVLAAGSTLLSLAGVEILVRALDPGGISYYTEASRYHLDKIPDADAVFAHRPGLNDTYEGAPVSINELGMRDRPVPPKEPGEFRILVLGDSVTFGWGARVEETFPRRLEESLASRLGDKVRTLNTGVGGYNSDQELAALRRYGDSVSPDLVILLYVSNDVEPTPRAPFDPWSEESISNASPPDALRLLLGRSWTYRLAVHTLRYRAGEDYETVPRGSAGWKSSMAAVSKMASFCRDRHLPFAIFLYRLVSTPVSDAVHEDLSSLARNERIPYADTLSWFKNANPREITNSRVDSHLNGKGHAILARGIERALNEWGLAPPAARE